MSYSIAQIQELRTEVAGLKRHDAAAYQEKRDVVKVTTKTGKYGTKQKHYEGDNGVTVVIETEGRNAGKVITVWRRQ